MSVKLVPVIAALALTSCAGGPFEWKYGWDKVVPGYNGYANSKTSGVYTWPSYAVGAIVYPAAGGGACIQSAQSAKARNAAGSGNITLKNTEDKALSVALSQQIKEAISVLQDKDDVATFADLSLFQICTIAKNQQLDTPSTVQLIQSALDASVQIAKVRPKVKLDLSSLKPDDVVASPATPAASSNPATPSATPSIPATPGATAKKPAQ